MAIANTSVFGGYTTSTVVAVSQLTTDLVSLQTMSLQQSNIYGQTLGVVYTPTILSTQRLSTFIKTAEDPVTGSSSIPTQTWSVS